MSSEGSLKRLGLYHLKDKPEELEIELQKVREKRRLFEEEQDKKYGLGKYQKKSVK